MTGKGTETMTASSAFPATRLRRNRQHPWLRRMVAETLLTPADLIWPLFVHDHEASLPVPSLPGVERLSIDGVVKAADEARQLGIPAGPIYAELKAGRTVTLEDGRIINGASLTGPARPGASVVYCTDTVFCEAAVALAQGADLLIHESTFSHGEAELAIARQHSTSTMAAQTALEAGVRQLVLTHLSPRYMPGNPQCPDDLLAEARAIFAETIMAKDFLSLDVIPAE